MKHSLKITLLLLLIFVLAQINGLFVVDYYIDIKESALAGRTVVHEEKYAEANLTAPVVENESTSFVYIFLALLMGTAFVLLLMKFKQGNFWKVWFFLSVVVTESIKEPSAAAAATGPREMAAASPPATCFPARGTSAQADCNW